MSKKKVKIMQYSITTVEKIMKNFGVKYSDIIKSFEIEDDIEKLHARVKSSGGRSGAFFYFTADHEFIIKTITSEELVVLRSMIKDYCDHIISAEGSFLSRIFGIYKIKIDKTRTFRIILQENLTSRLSNPVLFDMKGSTTDRRVSAFTFKEINDMPRDVVYKDIDFAENVRYFTVSAEEQSNILTKLTRDTKLLKKYLIMDYSLLIMVEKVTSLKNTLIEKHFVATHNSYIVFIGIIDYLQTYNTKKKLENKYKKLKNHNTMQLSAISPKPYKKRFLGMARGVFRRENVN